MASVFSRFRYFVGLLHHDDADRRILVLFLISVSVTTIRIGGTSLQLANCGSTVYSAQRRIGGLITIRSKLKGASMTTYTADRKGHVTENDSFSGYDSGKNVWLCNWQGFT